MVVKTLFLAFFLLSDCVYSQTPQFTIQDLGSLPNLQSCTATGLSQLGNVTGYCLNTIGASLLINPTTHGFLYSNGVLTDLNINALSTPTILPMAVNDSGIVAGAYVTINTVNPSLTATPFVVLQDGSVKIPQGQMQGALPFALNNAGQLAGSVIRVGESTFNLFVNGEAVLYTLASGATSILPAPSGGGATAFGINSTGTVAGAGVAQNGAVVIPLLWTNSKSQSLPLLAGYQQSLAASVNDSGAAAGVAFDVNFSQFADPLNQSHAVLFNTDGSVTDLGVLPGDRSSLATGINNSGSVVGVSSSKAPDFTVQLYGIFNAARNGYRPFLYTGGKVYDLNVLLTNGTGWTLTYAAAINDNGQIAGTGLFQGPNGTEQHGFLLTPAAAAPPGPSITGVVGAGLSVPAVTSISPNGLFSIFGSLLASGPASVTKADIVNNQLPTNLGGTCVESGTTKWGLFFVSSGQINALAGDLPASGTVPVSVVTNCGTANEVASPAINVPVAPASPEFLYFIANANGQNPVAAIEALTGHLVGAPGLKPGATFTPAHDGDILTAFGVAFGATTSTDPIGTLDTAAETVTSTRTLTLGGISVNPSYVGLTPGFAGLYQVNFKVPSGLAAGNQPLVLTVNGTPSPSGPYITIGN